MNVKNLLMVITAGALTACSSNNDLFDSTAIENNAKQSYAANFMKKYPNVDMSKGWDFSTKQTTFGLPGEKRAATRAVDYNYTAGNWYEVDNNTLSWMSEQLIEGQDNRALGKPFYMSVPGNEFTIVPIYQGQAGAMWNLHVVVDGVDIKLWDKINGESLGETVNNTNRTVTVAKDGTIQIKDEENDNWHNLQGQWYDWGYGNWNSLYTTDQSGHWKADGSSNNVTAVRSIPYTFKNLPVGANMYFYLEVTVSGNGEWGGKYNYVNSVGAQQSSLKGMMLALQDVPRPANIPATDEAMIIGCEDADLQDSDWDMNDLVLLVYGPKVPKPIEITEGMEVETRETVRYMIEDLGSIDDFDFNDIVIDVANIHTATPQYTNGVLTAWINQSTRQEAVIRHLGGTLPFQLTIGSTELEERAGVLGSDPNEVIPVTGWSINTHNISVKVKQGKNSGVYNNVTFPKAGEAPMIIAVDPTQNWMTERQSVPESWFYIPE